MSPEGVSLSGGGGLTEILGYFKRNFTILSSHAISLCIADVWMTQFLMAVQHVEIAGERGEIFYNI